MALLHGGLARGRDVSWGVGCCLNDACTYHRQGGREVYWEGAIFPSKCLQRCKMGDEGPWHQLLPLTDWKQGFIFSNLWSQRGERSVKGRREVGVPGETLGGEMKDIIQDKLSSPDVNERQPSYRNKWDGADLNPTFRLWEQTTILAPLCFLSAWH